MLVPGNICNNGCYAPGDGKYLARHMPVLGNVHPIKIENFDNFSWRHFFARSSFYIINWYGYPRGSHEKYLKEIVTC